MMNLSNFGFGGSSNREGQIIIGRLDHIAHAECVWGDGLQAQIAQGANKAFRNCAIGLVRQKKAKEVGQ